MRTLLLLFLFCSGVLFASQELEDQGQKAELFADSFVSKGHTVYATGHVVLAYDGTLFLGDRAQYDREADRIVVEGHVEILSRQGGKVLADRVVFEAGKNRVTFSDFYRSDRDDIWVYAESAEKQDGNYTLNNSVLSSCSVDNPDWSVHFGKAVYDSTSKYMRLRDVKLYAGKVPVLYTPYLGFSLERQRHSGFLMPHLGYGADEGFYYEQPYFWAISPSMDLELNPSIRTTRGYGLYGTFRFVDSPWSQGTIRTGYFKDKNSFVDEHNLKNDSHYGFELLYESSNFLRDWKPEGYRDGLYANIDLFNDIDYSNLQYSTLSHLEETSRFKESRLNYFLYNDQQYFGLRSRYFIDTTSLENNETIQELPALQYHKFSSELGTDYLHYSIDAQLHNYWREDGVRALRGMATFPVEFHMPLFDDYLNLTVEEKLIASDTKFMEGGSLNFSEDHYAALALHHNIELNSDMVRGYESGVHTMLLGLGYTKSTLLAEGDLHFEDIPKAQINDFDLNMLYDSRVALKMHHYWESYDAPFAMDYLVVADYYPENDSRWNLLRQEFHMHYGSYTLSTRFDYSIRYHSLSQLANTLSYHGEKVDWGISQTRKEYENDEHKLAQNDMSLDLHFRQSDQWTWFGSYSYDFKEKSSKNWEAGFTFDRKCWNITLAFKQDITPVLTKSGGGSIHNNAVMFQFNLVPFGGVGSRSFQNVGG
ncbi:LPS-assembly protein LptD [Nitratifractor salsuginis]|uniref:Organic solvent tolerance protein n=1 Tax=Nitratifractor salsuginis (strain DSM 16511 / JCM 12458 / E9I37-1) TaxID=749222 RepID=E6X0D9_NITSE|nr:LPS assembly protein LptD [Nitratifractor salsuginis]ADV45728.1 Organic solvent tolerance protein [Nitratifractor salsuginis DSM 16511]